MKRRSLWLAALFACLCFAQPPPPSPTPPKATQPKQDAAAEEAAKGDSGEKSSHPVTVTVVNAPKIDGTTKQHEEESATDWWMRIFTGLIFLATAVQAYIYWHQKRLMQEALAETKKSADAALKNAEAFRDSERAWVIVTKIWPITPHVGFNPVLFDITNCGRTVARLMDFRPMHFVVTATGTLEENSDYPGGELGGNPEFNTAEYGRVLAPKENLSKFPLNPALAFNDSEVEEINNGTLKWFIYGCIGYIDISGERRELQFCYRYTANKSLWTEHQGNFVMDSGGKPHYNRHT